MTGKHKKKKLNNLYTVTKKIFIYMKGSKYAVFGALIIAILSTVLTIIGPNQIGKITDYMSNGLIYGFVNLKGISKIGTFLVGIYLISAIFNYIQHYIMSVITLKLSKQLRKDISIKINRVPQKYFNSVSHGDILSRVTNDVSTLQQALSNSLPEIISSGTQFLGCLVMMLTTELRLSLCVFSTTIFGILLIIMIIKHSQKYFSARQKSLGKLNGYIEEMYSGHDVICTSRAEKNVINHFISLNKIVYDTNWKSQFLSGIMQPITMSVGNLNYVIICIIGSILALNGTISFGIIVSFILFARLFTSPMTQIAQGLTNIQTAAAAAGRIFEFLEAEELPDESNKTAILNTVQGNVAFEHIKFSYPDAPNKIIINDFTAYIKAGQKVAIVGPSGSGKTTLINLLMRFFEINSGSIKIDGINIFNMKRENVHNLFSMVLQETWLFKGTLRENLVYNMINVNEKDLKKVCKICSLQHFVDSLPNGFDTELSEHIEISAGQKQLITIARAMLQNNPMLILDEATSSIDTRTETSIQKAIDELTQEKTSFVIAHRLSTIKNADCIFVMKDGDIIETGTHKTLMSAGGFYADLYNSQFEHSAKSA